MLSCLAAPRSALTVAALRFGSHQVVALDPPTLNLRSLNLSYNSISSMRDISMYRQLAHLVLDGNRLTRLNGLNGLPFLKVSNQLHVDPAILATAFPGRSYRIAAQA